jgi:hypothetical protein
MGFGTRGTETSLVVLILAVWVGATAALVHRFGSQVIYVSLAAFAALVLAWIAVHLRDRR